jgi:hypothetical protein
MLMLESFFLVDATETKPLPGKSLYAPKKLVEIDVIGSISMKPTAPKTNKIKKNINSDLFELHQNSAKGGSFETSYLLSPPVLVSRGAGE